MKFRVPPWEWYRSNLMYSMNTAEPASRATNLGLHRSLRVLMSPMPWRLMCKYIRATFPPMAEFTLPGTASSWRISSDLAAIVCIPSRCLSSRHSSRGKGCFVSCRLRKCLLGVVEYGGRNLSPSARYISTYSTRVPRSIACNIPPRCHS